MKLNPNTTRPQIFSHYEHPWYKFESKSPIMQWDSRKELIRPNPPTKEAIKKAQFVDKTFVWRNDTRI